MECTVLPIDLCDLPLCKLSFNRSCRNINLMVCIIRVHDLALNKLRFDRIVRTILCVFNCAIVPCNDLKTQSTLVKHIAIILFLVLIPLYARNQLIQSIFNLNTFRMVCAILHFVDFHIRFCISNGTNNFVNNSNEYAILLGKFFTINHGTEIIGSDAEYVKR